MVDIFSSLATSFGLSTSAGLNAYLPLLVVALTARYTDLLKLNEPWDVMTNGWAIAALAVLLVIETLVDKIPAVDSINDIIQTFVRPVSGAILFAANSGTVEGLNPTVAFIAGLFLAGGVHGVKTAARPFVTAATFGTGNWAVSIIEDILSLIGTILAILFPIIVLLTIIFFFILFIWWWSRWRARASVA